MEEVLACLQWVKTNKKSTLLGDIFPHHILANVQFLLTLAVTQNCHMKQIDYVLAYTQVVAEMEMYMEAPKVFTFMDNHLGTPPLLHSPNQEKLLWTEARGLSVESTSGPQA